jgi:hypothetical protein
MDDPDDPPKPPIGFHSEITPKPLPKAKRK